MLLSSRDPQRARCIDDGDDHDAHIRKDGTHMLAIRNAPSSRQMILTASAKTMFCRTMRSVCREMRIASEILEGSSSIRTMSAASMAASKKPRGFPSIPMSALESTGASYRYRPLRMESSLPFSAAGAIPPHEPCHPAAVRCALCCRPALAADWLSPVSITQRRTSAFRERIASAFG